MSGLRLQDPHINRPLTLSQVNICSRHMNHKVTGNSNSVDSGAINLQFQGQVPFSQVQDDLMHSDLVLYQLLMQPPLFLPCLQHNGLLLLHLEDHAQQLLLLLQPIKEQCNQTLHHCQSHDDTTSQKYRSYNLGQACNIGICSSGNTHLSN